VPGFIDTHLHVGIVPGAPAEFDRCVLRHGVTTAILRPDEISNVIGGRGAALFSGQRRPHRHDLRVQLSSCGRRPISKPPARGSMLRSRAVLGHPKVIRPCRVQEIFPAWIHADPGCLAKLRCSKMANIDGTRRSCAASTSTPTWRRHPHRP